MKLDFNSESYARAYSKQCRLLPDVRLKPCVRPDAFRVSVLGSRSVWYDVIIYHRGNDELGCSCTCAAGQKDLLCYHVGAAWSMYLTFIRINAVPDIRGN